MLVSLNFEKDPDNNEQVHICELNQITYLKNDSDLTTDANFYYRGSRVSYKSIFRNSCLSLIIITTINVCANFRVFDHLVFSFFFHFNFSFFCENNATCQSGFTLKGYLCLCPPRFEQEHCEKGTSLSQHLQ